MCNPMFTGKSVKMGSPVLFQRPFSREQNGILTFFKY